MIKEEYAKIAKKYSLPEFRDIDAEFEISEIEHADFLVAEIRRKMHDKVEFVVEVMNGLLQPDPNSLSNMTEYHFFSDTEREGISKLFKEMMVLKRKAEGTGIGSEEEQARFIKEAFSNWMERKEKIKGMLLKMSESWTKEELPTAQVDYLR